MDEMIRRTIDKIYDQYSYSLRTKDLADTAALSPFHFTRKFRRTTGVTPGNYLGAVRIAQAKWLLLTTGLRVSDIMYRVGYDSVGSFTRKFTASVGVPPTLYRSSAIAEPVSYQLSASRDTGTVGGFLDVAAGCHVSTVVVGVFEGPLARGRPQQIAVLTESGAWRMDGIEPGKYYVIAVGSSYCWDQEDREVPIRDPAVLGSAGPLRIEPGAALNVPIRLSPWRPARMPVLFPLPCVTSPCLGNHP